MENPTTQEKPQRSGKPLFETLKRSGYIWASIAVISLGIFFRLYPATVSLKKDNTNVARLMVYANIRRTFERLLDSKYPGMPPEQRFRIANEKLKETISKEPGRIDKAVGILMAEETSLPYKFYLLEADPFHYYSLTKRILSTGKLSPKEENGKYLDELMLSPLGMWRNIELHPFIGALTYKAISAFNKGISVMDAVAIVPVIEFVIAMLLFLLLLRSLSVNAFAAFIGGIFFALSPVFLQRSSIGWFDTDPYNIIAVILAIYFTYKAVSGQTWRPVLMLALVSAIYIRLWQGWTFLPISIIVALFTAYISSLITHKDARPIARNLLMYILLLPCIALIVLTPKGFAASIKELGSILTEFIFMKTNAWPDIFITVSELKAPGLNKLAHLLGGYIFAALSVFGVARSFIAAKRNDRWVQTITLFSFLVITLLMARSAERFAIFFVVPSAVYCAIGINELMQMLFHIFARYNMAGRMISYSLGCALILSPLLYGTISASNRPAIYNTVWDKALNELKKISPVDAVVNSWWCPGHFIKATAERMVTFDGATMNTPQAYWMARALLETDESKSVGMLRMLNTSGNNTAEYLIKNKIPLDQAVDMIESVAGKSPDEAREILRDRLFPENIEHVVKLMNGKRKAYLLLYDDLMKSVIGLYYIKQWNFKKALEYQTAKGPGKGHMARRGSDENIAQLWAVSGGSTFIGDMSPERSRANGLIHFSNGVIFNPSTKECVINKLNNQLSGRPQSLLYVGGGELKIKRFPSPAIRLSVLLIEQNDGRLECAIAPENVLKSVIYRLYYMNGLGLKHFKRVIDESGRPFDTRVVIYEVVED